MENMGPSLPEMGKKTLDLTGERELRVGEGRKNFGHQFSPKYQGGQLVPSAFPHQLGLGGSPSPWFLAGEEDEEDEEEKMDMLWEDFNEELASVPPLCPLSPVINKGALAMKEAAGWLDGDEMIVVDLEKHGKGKHHRHPQDGRVVRRRKWSLSLMLRLLKMLFLVKKSRNPRTTPI